MHLSKCIAEKRNNPPKLYFLMSRQQIQTTPIPRPSVIRTLPKIQEELLQQLFYFRQNSMNSRRDTGGQPSIYIVICSRTMRLYTLNHVMGWLPKYSTRRVDLYRKYITIAVINY